MGLFSKKKRPEDSIKLPELPKLEFPSYEPQIRPFGDKPDIMGLKEVIRETKEQVPEIPVRKFIPQQGMERQVFTKHIDVREEKPLFVKLEKYKQAVNDIEHVKNRLREAEHLLDEIEGIRVEENRELEEWRAEINRLKEKLLDVDRKLFEV